MTVLWQAHLFVSGHKLTSFPLFLEIFRFIPESEKRLQSMKISEEENVKVRVISQVMLICFMEGI